MSRFSKWFMVGVFWLHAARLVEAQPAYFSLTGDFPTIGDRHDFVIDLVRPVASDEVLRFETFANGGGTNAAGDVIASGGIDSVLDLFEWSIPIQHGHDDDGRFTSGYDSLLSWPGVAEVDDVPLDADPMPVAIYRLLMTEFNDDASGSWALDIVGPADAVVFRSDSPTGTSTFDTLTAGNGAQVRFDDFYELNSGRVFKLRSGASFTIEQYLDIGNGTDGTLIVENPGTTLTTNTVNTTFLDWGQGGGTARINIRDGASVNLSAKHVNLATDTDPASVGILLVENDADLTVNTLNVGTGSGVGQISVVGSGSTITQNGASALTIGAAGNTVDRLLTIGDSAEFNTGTGTITVNPSGMILVERATFNANGPMTVASAGGALYGVSLTDQGVINSGDVVVRGASPWLFGRVQVDGYTLGIGTRATWNITGSLDVGTTGSGLVWIENAGRMTVSQDVTVYSDYDVGSHLVVATNGELDVAGKVHVEGFGNFRFYSGTVTAQSFVVDSGAWLTHEGGLLTVDGGQFTMGLGTLTIDSSTGHPTLRLENGAQGSVEVNPGVSPLGKEGVIIVGEDGQGRMEIVGGSHLVSDAGWIGLGTTFPGGGSGTVLVQGNGSLWELTNTLGWLGGLQVGRIGTGTLTIDDGGQVILREGGAVIGTSASSPLGQGSVGVATVNGIGSLLRIERGLNGGTLSIGTFDASTGATGELTVSNDGRVEAQLSTTIRPYGTLTLTRGGEIYTGSFTVDLLGTFNHEDGLLTVDGGQFDPGVADYTIGGAVPTDLPVVRLINGASASLSGTLVGIGFTSQGRMEILGGSQVDLPDERSVLGAGGVSGITGEIIIDGKGSRLMTDEGLVIGDYGLGMLRILNGGSVSNSNSSFEPIGQSGGGVGVVEVVGKAPDDTPSSWTSSGEIQVGREGLGTLTISAGGQVQSPAGSIAHFAGSAGSAATVADLGSSWQVTGTLYVGGSSAGAGDSGTLHVVNDGQVIAGTTTVWPTGTIALDGGIISTDGLQLDGRLVGSGAIVLGAADALVNSGAVSPGSSPGIIIVSGGNYVQNVDGILEIEIGGTSPAHFDRLHVVSGTATLAGTLDVSLIDPTGGGNIFAPNAGDSFEIFTAANGITGSFLPPALPTLDTGLFWRLDNNGNAITLSVVPALEADFDVDGDVDGADLTIWKAVFGAGNGADADKDGDSDGNDFLVWQRQNGNSVFDSMGGGSSVAVPEPTSALLAVVGLLAFTFSRRRNLRR